MKIKILIYMLAASGLAGLLMTGCESEIPVTDVELNEFYIILALGESEKLIATIEPSDATNQNVTWLSSDYNIATVTSSGLVTAISEGTTSVTVTTEDGGHTATCTVHSYDDRVRVTGVSLNKSSITLNAGESA